MFRSSRRWTVPSWTCSTSTGKPCCRLLPSAQTRTCGAPLAKWLPAPPRAALYRGGRSRRAGGGHKADRADPSATHSWSHHRQAASVEDSSAAERGNGRLLALPARPQPPWGGEATLSPRHRRLLEAVHHRRRLRWDSLKGEAAALQRILLGTQSFLGRQSQKRLFGCEGEGSAVRDRPGSVIRAPPGSALVRGDGAPSAAREASAGGRRVHAARCRVAPGSGAAGPGYASRCEALPLQTSRTAVSLG